MAVPEQERDVLGGAVWGDAGAGATPRARRRGSNRGARLRAAIATATGDRRPRPRSNQQNASGSSPGSRFVTITLPVHPFAGQRLLVLRELCGAGRGPLIGRLEVEDPSGRTLQVPIEWTDRAPPTALHVGPQSALHAAAAQLAALAKLLEGWSLEPHAAGIARGMLGHGEPEPGASVADPVARPRPRASTAAGGAAGHGAAAKRTRGRRHGGKP